MKKSHSILTLFIILSIPSFSSHADTFGSELAVCVGFADKKFARIGTWYRKGSSMSTQYSAAGAKMKVQGGINAESPWSDMPTAPLNSGGRVTWTLNADGYFSTIRVTGFHRATLKLTGSNVSVGPTHKSC